MYIKNIFKIVPCLVSVLFLAGCAHQGYMCPLGKNGEKLGACASQMDTYRSSFRSDGSGLSVYSGKGIAQDNSTLPISKNAIQVGEGNASNSPGYRYLYSQPKVYKTWINTYVNASNVAVGPHSVYWVGDPGHWNAPAETTPGQNSQLLSPVTTK